MYNTDFVLSIKKNNTIIPASNILINITIFRLINRYLWNKYFNLLSYIPNNQEI